MKALDMMKSSKGRIFTVVFTKKNGTERMMNGQYIMDQDSPVMGYVKMRDVVLRKKDSKTTAIRNVNLQTLKSLTISGSTYKIS